MSTGIAHNVLKKIYITYQENECHQFDKYINRKSTYLLHHAGDLFLVLVIVISKHIRAIVFSVKSILMTITSA